MPGPFSEAAGCNCFAELEMEDWNDSERHRACKFGNDICQMIELHFMNQGYTVPFKKTYFFGY